MPAVAEKAAEKKKKMVIPKEQWDLPVAFSPDGGKLVSLKEVTRESEPSLSLAQLSGDQRAQLVKARIEAQPKYEIAMLGAGLIDKKRAVNEVENQTKIGRSLVEIEQILINNLLEEAGPAQPQ
jgi:hypothetical protein